MTGGAALSLDLLRTPRLTLADGCRHTLERKDAALLAVLAADGPCPAARAAALLWPDSPDSQARANLRQRLFRLRKLAGTDIVITDSGILRLAPCLVIDMLQFAQALAEDPAAAGAGDLLSGHDYSDSDALALWVSAARQRWRYERAERLAAGASELEAAQHVAAALVLAQRIVADEPLAEHAHRRVMRLHYLRGDRAAALAAYQQCRDVLRGELGTRPNHETDRLAALIESSAPLPQAAPAPRAIATLRPPRMVGRESAWRQMESACLMASLVLVEGEAGIGKTRLLGDFAAAHGNAPFFGARPGDASLPYSLLARIVRGLSARFPGLAAGWVMPELARVAPELGISAAGTLSALRLQQALVQALDEWRQAGLEWLVIDDLHHADTATLELLPALTAMPGPAPRIVWLFSVRNGELPAAAAPWLAAQEVDDALARIALGPLDLDGVRALLDSLALPGLDAARWAPMLARHTGGNPLFLLETLIALLDQRALAPCGLAGDPPALPAPERIGRLIERRLAQLSPSALKLARVAAIAGLDFSAALSAQVLGLHALDIADSWRELEAAQVIRDDAFAHDLIFEGTLRSIPQAIARLLHGDVALALQGAGAPAARLAAHWAAAQEWSAAGDAYVGAARAAFAAGRRVEEAQLWDEAVRSYEKAGDIDKAFDARHDSIDTALATRPPDTVLQLAEGLLAAARDELQRLRALLCRVKALFAIGRRRDAAAAADQAVKLADMLGEPWLRFEAARQSALGLSPGPRAAEGIERLRGFASQLATGGTARQRCDYCADLAHAVHVAGRRSEAALLYSQALDAARAFGDLNDELISLSNLGGLLMQLGRPEAGRLHVDRACRLLARQGDPDGLPAAAALMNLSMIDASLGRFDAALHGFELAAQKLGPGGGTANHAACETHLANLWLHLGQPSRALQALRAIPLAVATQLSDRAARRLTIEARIDRALGRPALPRLQQALALFSPTADPLLRMLAELDHSRELDPALALAACERVIREADALELLAVAMRARLFAIDALHRGGDAALAADGARDAMAGWQDCRPADQYWPEALWIASEALRSAGDEAAARALLREAVGWIRQTAVPHVPAPFVDSFLHRNPVNRMILAAAGGLVGDG